ncbi:MAG: FtsQ-type POTRA domain-containing protein [Gammaproteobacteria bacterium]|nr:MAG: FtsQ-type POTRA domain-containing protein [Gammaproteobacteria bacterium]
MRQAARIRPGEPASPGSLRRILGGAAGVVLSLALLTGAVQGWRWLTDPGTLPIREVRVLGEFRHLSPARMEQGVADRATGGFFGIDVEGIRKVLLDEPWVREVSVRRVWPDTLQVTVLEQVPVARWGEHALVNDAGELFRPDPATIPRRLVRLEGPRGSERELLARMRYLESLLRPLGLALAELEMDRRGAWSFRLAQGPLVMVGRGDFEARTARLARIWTRVLRPRAAEIERIDLRYANGLAVRYRQGGQALSLRDPRPSRGEC